MTDALSLTANIFGILMLVCMLAGLIAFTVNRATTHFTLIRLVADRDAEIDRLREIIGKVSVFPGTHKHELLSRIFPGGDSAA